MRDKTNNVEQIETYIWRANMYRYAALTTPDADNARELHREADRMLARAKKWASDG